MLLQRISYLESSLSAAQDSELSLQLAERDAENTELQAAVEELEEELRREVDCRDMRLRDSEERIKDLEAQLAAKDCMLNAAQVMPGCSPASVSFHAEDVRSFLEIKGTVQLTPSIPCTMTQNRSRSVLRAPQSKSREMVWLNSWYAFLPTRELWRMQCEIKQVHLWKKVGPR